MLTDRRIVLTGLGATAFSVAGTTAYGAGPDPWLSYEARLRARLADAGGGEFEPAVEAGLIRETNNYRRLIGRAPLREDDELVQIARAHAADMAARSFFGHTTPEGFTNADRSGLLARVFTGFFGENLAVRRGPPGRPWAAADIVTSWRRSGSHRDNLGRVEFTHVGHGVAENGGRWFAAAVYAGLSARLREPLPLRIEPGDVNSGLAAARPALAGFTFSDPHAEPPEKVWALGSRPPGLGPGVWRLMPIMQSGAEAASGHLRGLQTGAVNPAGGALLDRLDLGIGPVSGGRLPGRERSLGGQNYNLVWGPIVVI